MQTWRDYQWLWVPLTRLLFNLQLDNVIRTDSKISLNNMANQKRASEFNE